MKTLIKIGIIGVLIVVGMIWVVVVTLKGMMAECLALREGYVPCDLDEVEWLDDELIEELEEELESKGFTWDKDYERKEEVDGKQSSLARKSTKYIKRYICEQYGTSALIYGYRSKIEQGNKQAMIAKMLTNYGIELHTQLEDGKNIITISEQIPQVDKEVGTTYFYCWDPEKIEEAIINHFNEVKQRLQHTQLVHEGMSLDLETYMENRLSRRYSEGVKRGIYRFDGEKQCYRYTMKGAFKYLIQGIIMYCFDKKNAPCKAFKVEVETQKVML